MTSIKLKIKNFLKKFETVRILLGLRNTKKIFDLINKSDFEYYDEDKNQILINFKVEDKNYKLVTNKFDFRSHKINSGRQNHKILFLVKYLKKGNFFDIGSNYGEFSIVLQKTQNTVYAFEPNRYVFDCLKETSKNFINMKVFNKAISDIEGETLIKNKFLNSGGTSIEHNKLHKKIYSFQDFISSFNLPEIVKTIEIKRFMENELNNENEIINIKIDVEGHETSILENILSYKNLTKNKIFIMYESFNHHISDKNKMFNILKEFEQKNFLFVKIPSQIEDYDKFKHEYTPLDKINLNEDCEICLTNYDIFG